MKITASKKRLKTLLIVLLILLSTFFIGVYLLISSGSSGYTTIKEYYKNCENSGCIYNEKENSKEAIIEIIDIKQLDDINVLITFNEWNEKTNDLVQIELKIKESLINNLAKKDTLGSYHIKISAKNRLVPLPYWSSKSNKIDFSQVNVTRVNLVSNQNKYLEEENGIDYKLIKEKINNSLGIKEDLDESKSLSSQIFVFKDTISRVGPNSAYEESNLYEYRLLASKQTSEELKYSCKILKEYHPNVPCANPIEILDSYQLVKSALASEGFSDYNVETLLENSVINNVEYVTEIRSNSDKWVQYNSDKNILTTNQINNYVYAVLEYLYYSDPADVENSETLMNQITKLYEYSQYLIYISKGSLCSRISYLPLLVEVTEDTDIENDLEYLLENYPFESECTHKAGGKGVCSIDLKERMSCIKLLSNSLTYYDNSEETNLILKNLVDDTIFFYLTEYKDRTGLWGKDDINLLMGLDMAEEFYPIRFYDYEGNFLLYTILDRYYEQ